MARDCLKADPNAQPGAASNANVTKFDTEYDQLMAELGESGAKGGGKSTGISVTGSGSDVPPWRKPEMWQSTTPSNNNAQSGYKPPQGYGGAANYGSYGGQQQYYQGGNYPQGYGGQDYSAAYAQYYQQQYSQSQAPA